MTSKIEWSEAVWNPTTGCTQIVLHPERLSMPMRWKKSRLIVVNSTSDLFHEAIPDEFIAEVFAVMALTPWHTYQVSTKRPERMREFCSREAHWWGNKAMRRIKQFDDRIRFNREIYGKPLPNVWFGARPGNKLEDLPEDLRVREYPDVAVLSRAEEVS